MAVPSVVMSSVAHTEEFVKAVVLNAKASSELFLPGYDNSANSAADDSVPTFWQVGVDGYGEGQIIDM